jgi:hypothetical protein
MGWVSLALALLKFVNGIMTWAHERGLISQGYDKAIAEVTQSIFVKTEAGKAIMEKVNAMSPEEVDAGLRDLEPK